MADKSAINLQNKLPKSLRCWEPLVEIKLAGIVDVQPQIIKCGIIGFQPSPYRGVTRGKSQYKATPNPF